MSDNKDVNGKLVDNIITKGDNNMYMYLGGALLFASIVGGYTYFKRRENKKE